MFNKQGGKPSCKKKIKIMSYKRYTIKNSTQIVANPKEEGESIEQMLRRLTTNKEPIPANVPPIYTPKEEGVIPDYDIRADRHDIAYEATNKFAASQIAKSAERGQEAPEITTQQEQKTE